MQTICACLTKEFTISGLVLLVTPTCIFLFGQTLPRELSLHELVSPREEWPIVDGEQIGRKTIVCSNYKLLSD